MNDLRDMWKPVPPRMTRRLLWSGCMLAASGVVSSADAAEPASKEPATSAVFHLPPTVVSATAAVPSTPKPASSPVTMRFLGDRPAEGAAAKAPQPQQSKEQVAAAASRSLPPVRGVSDVIAKPDERTAPEAGPRSAVRISIGKPSPIAAGECQTASKPPKTADCDSTTKSAATALPAASVRFASTRTVAGGEPVATPAAVKSAPSKTATASFSIPRPTEASPLKSVSQTGGQPEAMCAEKACPPALAQPSGFAAPPLAASSRRPEPPAPPTPPAPPAANPAALAATAGPSAPTATTATTATTVAIPERTAHAAEPVEKTTPKPTPTEIPRLTLIVGAPAEKPTPRAKTAAKSIGFESPAPPPGLLLLGPAAKRAAKSDPTPAGTIATAVAAPAVAMPAVAAPAVASPTASATPSSKKTEAPSEIFADSRARLEVATREAVTHRCGRILKSASTSDETICKVVCVDSQNVAVLGVQNGVATVELAYADGTSESLAVEVRSGRAADGEDKITSVLESLKQMYPAAGLEIRAKGAGVLRVTGTAKSEAEARQIVSLVRKVFLMPVEDGVGVAAR